MNTAGKLSAYGVSLALAAVGGWWLGTAVGPLSGKAGVRGGEDAAHGDAHSGTVAGATHPPGGLTSSRGGYTLTPTTTTLPAGEPGTVAFEIRGPDGEAVTEFDVEHEKRMHAILLRRDTTGFQHVHPTMAPDGTWTVPVTLDAPGSYRLFADFTPTGAESMTLGADLAVPGDFRPVEHDPSRVARVDGYEVLLDGALTPGRDSALTVTVSEDGRPITDLEPYLGAFGHLVALRQGDLAHLHVHPSGGHDDRAPAGGPHVEFSARVPSAGTYRLFLDFRHRGVVRTAEFTVIADGDTTQRETSPSGPGVQHGHG